jgi:membrane protease YdiL (CAAX protease family)
LKALGHILLYLAATVLVGALLAPPLYWLAHALAGHFHSASLSAFIEKTDFQRYFHRAVTITALILLWPLMRVLKIQNLGYDIGLKPDRWGRQRLLAGFLTGLLTLLILGGIFLLTGVYRMHSHIPYAKLAWLPVTAVIVSVIEEFLFRGVLQGTIRRTAMDGFSLMAVAVLFAAVHFLSPAGANPPAVYWWSGLKLLPDALGQFRDPALLLGGFTTMLVVGIILGYARLRTRSLWMPTGLHIGWIMGKMGLLEVTRQSVAWPWLGPDILIGLAPLITVMITWGIVWFMIKDVR